MVSEMVYESVSVTVCVSESVKPSDSELRCVPGISVRHLHQI